MAKKLGWAEMDKSGIPLAKLIEGFALYNRTTNKSSRSVDWSAGYLMATAYNLVRIGRLLAGPRVSAAAA